MPRPTRALWFLLCCLPASALAIDNAWVRVSLVGIDLITVEARVVVASIDTYLKYSEAVGTVAPVAKPLALEPTSTEAVLAENAALRARLAATSAALGTDAAAPPKTVNGRPPRRRARRT